MAESTLTTTHKKDILIDRLNLLLADYQIYYQNLRGFHWNIQGKWFFQLHDKFEELYREASETIDKIAERIRSLGATPLHAFDDYFQKAQLNAAKNISDGEQAVQIAVKNNQVLLFHLKDILAIASQQKDEGTATLITDLITATEKRIWMLKSFLV